MSINNSSASSGGADGSIRLLQKCQTAFVAVRFPSGVPHAAKARTSARAAVVQLDDYILPRYRNLNVALLTVLGGSTGAGKSTLVNIARVAATGRARVAGKLNAAIAVVFHRDVVDPALAEIRRFREFREALRRTRG